MEQAISLAFFLVTNGGALWALPGFLVGRWYAETFRAKADMERVWNGRKNYRED
jgi:hypothetical protein